MPNILRDAYELLWHDQLRADSTELGAIHVDGTTDVVVNDGDL